MFTAYSIGAIWFSAALLLVVVVYLAVERVLHQIRLNRIPVRIHVNGTRGKSSVARLIAAGLRGGGLTTVCKTTGTMARVILPNGQEQPIVRIGRTNIIEQVDVVKLAHRYRPEALVIECMAVQPLLQSLCELKLVQATHGVLCNARADHLDVMGPTEHDVALALAGTVPVKGVFITPEKKHLEVFRQAVDDRHSELVTVDAKDISAVTDDEMLRFSYLEYKENVALALKVCERCQVPRSEALSGMWEAIPDPGALIVKTVMYRGQKITFANGFAANDPQSTEQLWEKVLNRFPQYEHVVGLINCRDDRGDRSRQMAEVISAWPKNDYLLAIGSGTDVFKKCLPSGYRGKLVDGQGWSLEMILDHLANEFPSTGVLAIGVCNIAKIGFELLNYFCSQEGVSND